jgi:universal stress protein E
MRSDGVAVRHEVVWDHPSVAAVLRKIAAAKPDLVMQQSGEHRYLMGLSRNDDWDLLRASPAHLWFVTDGRRPIDHVVTAIASVAGDDEFIAATDHDVFRLANHVAQKFDASNHPVHAYQVPRGLAAYAMYAPELSSIAQPSSLPSAEQTHAMAARRHGRSIRAFAEHFHLDPDSVRVERGSPGDVLAKAARDLDAGLIVMGARNLGRWERALKTVTAEAVLDATPCDVLFVKRAEDTAAPGDPSPQATSGRPAIDLEQAILDPQRAFGSPDAIVNTSELSIAMRKRLLRIWAHDIREQLAETNEGGPPVDVDADLIGRIDAALTAIDAAAR